MRTRRRWISGLAVLTMCASGFTVIADAQEIYTGRYGQQSGEELYHGICQGCHMPDAKGATGAGTYPALANDAKLATPIYPITVVLNGQRAMPSFGRGNPPFPMPLTDQQIANVLNYVRTHFGNAYQDAITPQAVKAARAQMDAQHTAPPAPQDKLSASH